MASHNASLYLSLLLLQMLSLSKGNDELVVTTTRGKVRGVRLPVPDESGSVVAFLGIPYAKPPVKELRFKPPHSPSYWSGVREATSFASACYQFVDNMFPGFPGAEMWNPNANISEDCLYLNVWVPSPKPLELVPVMVWIYGGGFWSGTTSLDVYDGRSLSHLEHVIVVSMNYRLGPFGFLALPDSDVKGNAGLFDQRLALRWVSENIGAFGGDPSMVTLFGESAGSASVAFHVLSAGSHNLFNRVILQSGTPNAVWATVPLSEAQNRSLTLAKLLGCPLRSSIEEVEACLQKVHPKEVVNHQYDVIRSSLIALPFVPTVDGDFLLDTPAILLESGLFKKTDILLGVNKDEGSYFLVYGAPGFGIDGESVITRDQFLEGVTKALPWFSEMAQEAAAFQYTDWTDEHNGQKNRDGLCRMVGDLYITCPSLDFARKYTLHAGRTQMFYFDHRSSVNPWPEWMGVMHGYEIEFVFGLPLNRSLGYTDEEVAMSRKIMKHWANFARTGNPSVDGSAWPYFTLDKQEYITLNSDPPQTHQMLRAQQCKFWDSFLPKLQDFTVGIDEVELQWKTQFHRWLSYMLDWKNQFNEYNSARKKQCESP
ncbi:cholinesterase-like [Denticeps clupeoides]|uniref:Carboxylic ester hydrolase n=1 Tax=Denticeps clupeoides TaxID=299321 RepID=A0AAY4DDT4_9TELE|nr:cholinesterase-like [Denticeps clupeoides]XP_028818346.1 cholinesterase-like [Denticeps clupeoides]